MGIFTDIIRSNFDVPQATKDSETFPVIASQYSGPASHPARLDVLQNAYQKSVWVYACIYAIASSCAQVPFRIYRKKNDSWVQLENHPLVNLFNRPNKLMSRYDFWEATLTYLETTGNNYWEVVGDPVKELYPLRPDRMVIVPDRVNYIKKYTYEVNSKKVDLDPEDIWHLKYFNPNNDYYGLSPIQAAADSLTLDFRAIDYNKKLFENDATPGGVLETAGSVNESTKRRILSQWGQMHKGISKTHSIALLSDGLSYKQVAISPKDLEYLSLRRMTKEEIHAVFGVPLIMTQDLTDANYANARQQERIFYQTTIKPKLIKLTECLNAHFIQPRYGEDIVGMFDFSGISALQEDQETKTAKANSVREDFKNSLITRDEARSRLNIIYDEDEYDDLELNTVEGDVFYMPISMIPVGTVIDDTTPADDQGKSLPNNPENEMTWKAFVRETLPLEISMTNRLAVEFHGLYKEMMKKFDTVETDETKAYIDYEIEKYFFDQDKAKKKLQKTIRPYVIEGVKGGANYALAKLGISIDFNMADPKVQKFIKDKVYDFWKYSVDETLIDGLKETLTVGTGAGESLLDLRRRVQDVFDGYWRGERPAAQRIARTEALASYNYGNIEGARQSGVVSKKKWISARDAKVRDDHIQAEIDYGTKDKAIDIDMAFIVGGVNMDRPGDPAGGAANVINCRCVASFITKPVSELGKKQDTK